MAKRRKSSGLERFRLAATEASERGSPTSGPGRVLTPRHEDSTAGRRSALAAKILFLLGTAVLIAGCIAAWLTFSSTLGRTAHPLYLVLAEAAIPPLAWLLVRRTQPSPTLAAIAASIGLLVLGLFFYGASQSVILNGHVYAASSPTARSYELSKQITVDLKSIASYDHLLTYNLTDARAHYAEYAPAATALTAIATRWSTYSLSGLPDPGFIEAITQTKTSANYAAQAVHDKSQLLTVTDPALDSQATSERGTMVSAALAASRDLVAISQKYGYSLASAVHE